MDWVKLHTRYYDDARIEALPDADAEIMFTRGLARAGELERAGFIPEESLPKLARRRRYAASTRALLASGLWTRVDGGYQITNWDHWQDALDALVARRTADRERQRRRRASVREERQTGARAESSPPRNQTRRSLSRDNGHVSRDVSRDVTHTEEEEDLEGVQVGNQAYAPRAREAEPPPRCPKHLDDPDPPPCGPCADARRTHDRWERADADRRARQPTCRKHRGQPAHNCGICRAEKLADGAEPTGPPIADARSAVRAAIRKPQTRPGRVRGLDDLRAATEREETTDA